MFKWFRKKELSIRDRPGDLAGACYCIAAADGELHESEVRLLTEQVHELAGSGLSFDEIEGMVKVAHEELARVGLDGYLRGLGRGLSAEARSQLLGAAAAIAAADGTLAKEERHVYFKLAAALDFARDKADVILSAVTAPPPLTKRSAVPEGGAADASAETARVAAALTAAGWADPLASLVEVGIEIEGFGAAAFQRTNDRGTLLRLEHHPEDRSAHLHVTDDSDAGTDVVIFYGPSLDALLALVVAMQADVTPANFDEHLSKIAAVCPDVRRAADDEPAPAVAD